MTGRPRFFAFFCARQSFFGLCLGFVLFLSGGLDAQAQVCATPQNNGANITTANGQLVNGYFTPANGSFAAGSQPTIALSGARGSTTWAVGDLALLIQMQCVDLDRTESDSYGDGVPGRPASGFLPTPAGTCRVGQHEYVPAAAGSSATSFVAGAPLQFTYVQANPTGNSTRRSFQVIRVPQYGNLTLGGTLQGLAWNGSNGGVATVDVANTLNFAGQAINMAASGFRGGGGRPSNTDGNNPNRFRDPAAATNSHASKAEGIAGTPRLTFTDNTPFDRIDSAGTVVTNAGAFIGYPGTGTTADFDFARGAPGNAGGGGQFLNNVYHNGGGGGGGNGGGGGRGGFGWRGAGWAGVSSDYSNIEAVTGQHLAAYGGAAFGGGGLARVVMGGGGGAGDQNGNSANNNVMSGATGGGIVLIRAGSLAGSGVIDVRGGLANSNPLNDAAGAGAAGGSAVVISPNWTAGLLTVNAQGGQGGDSWITGGSAHSPGGGGGGGVVVRSGPVSANIGGGTNGLTNTADNPPGGASHGALPGNLGVDLQVSESSDPVSNSGYRCQPQTNLSLTKTANPSSISIGQTVLFTLTIGNAGPQNANNASLLDVLPAGLGTLTFISSTGTVAGAALTGGGISGNTATATFNLPINETLTVVLQATAAANGAPVNQATVSPAANASDVNLSNNTGTAAVVIGPSADLSASKSASTPSLVVGQTTLFTLVYANAGPSPVTGARLQDVLPASLGTLTFVSSSGLGSALLTNSATSATTFNGTATLPVGSTLTVVLRATAGTIGAVVNTATIAPPVGTTDTNSANNSGTVTLNVGPQADLSVSKSATPTVVNPEQTTTFTIVVFNNGPNSATGARLSDSLPAGLSGLTLTSAISSGGAGTLTARATSASQFDGTLTLPAFSSVTLSLRAIAGGVGEQVNQVSVTAPANVIDPTPGNNQASATVTIPLATLLTIAKTNSASVQVAGNTTVYAITVSNGGPNSADDSVLSDPLAAGLNCTSISCSSSGGAICPSNPTVAALQGAGLTLPTFPASSEMVFLLFCAVTASGQ